MTQKVVGPQGPPPFSDSSGNSGQATSCGTVSQEVPDASGLPLETWGRRCGQAPFILCFGCFRRRMRSENSLHRILPTLTYLVHKAFEHYTSDPKTRKAALATSTRPVPGARAGIRHGGGWSGWGPRESFGLYDNDPRTGKPLSWAHPGIPGRIRFLRPSADSGNVPTDTRGS